MELKEEILEILVSIREYMSQCIEPYWASGICRMVDNNLRHHYGIDESRAVVARLQLLPYFKRWVHYSGNANYPVPASSGASAKEAFYLLPRWDSTTEYGRLRWELLDYLIVTLTEETDKARGIT